jgi:hypothetical protein
VGLAGAGVAEQDDGVAGADVAAGSEGGDEGGFDGWGGVEVEVGEPFDAGELRVVDAAGSAAFGAGGWAVLPCHSPAPSGCSCGRPDCSSPAKHPRTRHGLHESSANPDVIRAWWCRWPDANVGIRTGSVSSLVVVDVDPGHGGLDTVRRLQAEGPLPEGLRVRTGSGGWHLYFAHPGGVIRNSAGTALGPGVDVRGDGGYVIAPPSRHRSGGSYQWQGRWTLPDLPPHLLERVRPPKQPAARLTEPLKIDRSLSAWAARALEDEAHQVRFAAAGGRNHRLNRRWR